MQMGGAVKDCSLCCSQCVSSCLRWDMCTETRAQKQLAIHLMSSMLWFADSMSIARSTTLRPRALVLIKVPAACCKGTNLGHTLRQHIISSLVLLVTARYVPSKHRRLPQVCCMPSGMNAPMELSHAHVTRSLRCIAQSTKLGLCNAMLEYMNGYGTRSLTRLNPSRIPPLFES